MAARLALWPGSPAPGPRRHIFLPDTYQRVLCKHLLHLHGKARHPAPHIRSAAGEIDPDTMWRGDHDRSSPEPEGDHRDIDS